MLPAQVAITVEPGPGASVAVRSYLGCVAPMICPQVDAERLALIVSELVTNAASLEAGPVTVSLRPMAEGGVRVEVRDHGYGMPEPGGSVGAGEPRWGLQLVARFSDEWGVDQFLPGKIVWSVLRPDRPAPR